MKELKEKFELRFDGIYYIPDNAEDSNDWVTFNQMESLCEDEWQTSKILREKFSDPNDLLEYLITFVEWEFPSTLIEELKNYD